jgi:hypothetical protein
MSTRLKRPVVAHLLCPPHTSIKNVEVGSLNTQVMLKQRNKVGQNLQQRLRSFWVTLSATFIKHFVPWLGSESGILIFPHLFPIAFPHSYSGFRCWGWVKQRISSP